MCWFDLWWQKLLLIPLWELFFSHHHQNQVLVRFSLTTRSRPAQSHRQTRCTLLRYDETRWSPHRYPLVLAWPLAPSAPGPSSAGSLWGGERGERKIEEKGKVVKEEEERDFKGAGHIFSSFCCWQETGNTKQEMEIRKHPQMIQTSAYSSQEVRAGVAHRDHAQHGGFPGGGSRVQTGLSSGVGRWLVELVTNRSSRWRWRRSSRRSPWWWMGWGGDIVGGWRRRRGGVRTRECRRSGLDCGWWRGRVEGRLRRGDGWGRRRWSRRDIVLWNGGGWSPGHRRRKEAELI